MKKIWYYFSFLMICSCNCDQGNINTTETTGYEVTFPDGSKKEVKSQNNSTTTAQPVQRAPEARKPVSTEAGQLLADKGDYVQDRGVVSPKNPIKSAATSGLTALKNVLPVACELLETKWLETEMKAREDILTTNSTASNNPNVNACFFRWDNGILPNCGIFLQIMENPVPDEVENYATYFIQGKLSGGEMDMSNTNYKYEKYNTVGIAGAYSAEQGKYFWQISPERVFMLAFNTGLSKNTEKVHADAIAKHVMGNYEKFLKTQSK